LEEQLRERDEELLALRSQVRAMGGDRMSDGVLTSWA
jgi:ribosomal protein L29